MEAVKTPDISFDAGGGEGTMDPVKAPDDLNYKIPECRFIRSGMTFQYWKAYETDSKKELGNYDPGEILSVTVDTTLEAFFSEEQEVTFKVSAAEGIGEEILKVAPDSVNLHEGDTAKVSIRSSEDDEIRELYYIDDAERKTDLMDKVGSSYVDQDTGNMCYDCTFTMPKSNVTVYVVLGDKIISSTGVSLNKEELTLDVGGTETLIATILPEDATDKTVTWTSSDEAVVTVDDNGKVTAADSGEAVITATTADGKKNASCKVTVSHKWKFSPTQHLL